MFDRKHLLIFSLLALLVCMPAGYAQSTDQSQSGSQTTQSGTATQDSTAATTSETNKDEDKTKGDSKDQAELASKAGEVLREVSQAADKGIPTELLEQAKGLIVIPSVIKGAFGFGGRWGEGLMVGRDETGTWGTPSYVEISGASAGFQIGVSATDLILVLTSKDAIDSLLKGKVKLGADAAVAAGPVGRTGSVSSDVKMSGPIYSYSRSKGVFAGVSLDGSVISIDDSANQKVYGPGVTGTQILQGKTVQANATVQPFLEAVRANTPAKAE